MEGGVEVLFYPFFNVDARWGWVLHDTSWLLYHQEKPFPLCTGGWMGLGLGLKGRGKFHTTGL